MKPPVLQTCLAISHQAVMWLHVLERKKELPGAQHHPVPVLRMNCWPRPLPRGLLTAMPFCCRKQLLRKSFLHPPRNRWFFQFCHAFLSTELFLDKYTRFGEAAFSHLGRSNWTFLKTHVPEKYPLFLWRSSAFPTLKDGYLPQKIPFIKKALMENLQLSLKRRNPPSTTAGSKELLPPPSLFTHEGSSKIWIGSVNISGVWGEKKLLNASTWSLGYRKKINLFISLKSLADSRGERKENKGASTKSTCKKWFMAKKSYFCFFLQLPNL